MTIFSGQWFQLPEDGWNFFSSDWPRLFGHASILGLIASNLLKQKKFDLPSQKCLRQSGRVLILLKLHH
jgi:hypothetical protein